MTDVFVSYARADREKVQQIASALSGLGFEVWWDHDLAPGQQYAAEIGALLKTAKAVVVVWSAQSVDRSWVLDEAAVGRDRQVLAPVRIDGSEPPLGFRQVETLDLSGWAGDANSAGFQQLVRRLTALRGAAPMPHAALSAMASTPRRNRRAWVMPTLAVAAVAGGLFAASQFWPQSAPADGPPTEMTDAPGADQTYGLTEEELVGFGPQDTIRIALATTDLEAIEAGAAAGDPLGQTLSCLAFSFGEGVGQDVAAARPLCEAAAAQGSALAQLMISRWTRAGEAGFAADAGAADALLQRAADARDPRALTELARAYLENGDLGAAAQNAEAAALLGHHPAEVLRGWMFENGQGAPQNDQEAFRWYDAAAEKAFPAGLTATGRLLEEGRGAPQDFARARARYEEAAGQGDGEAAFRLARLLEMGLGGAADAARAADLRAQATEAGFVEEPPAPEGEALQP